jgi:hypothetical protein
MLDRRGIALPFSVPARARINMSNVTDLPAADLAKLAERIKSLHSEIVGASRTTIQKALDAGSELHKAKKQAGHGNWAQVAQRQLCAIGATSARLHGPRHQQS